MATHSPSYNKTVWRKELSNVYRLAWLKHIIWDCFYNYPKYHIIQHYRNLQIESTSCCSGKIISSFILFTGTRHIFAGIDSTGFKITHASEYYTSRAKLRRKKYAKLSIGADVLKQIICNIKVRRAPTTRHDNIDFRPVITRISKIKPLIIGSCCR